MGAKPPAPLVVWGKTEAKRIWLWLGEAFAPHGGRAKKKSSVTCGADLSSR